jgi:hypothetical protein
MHDVSNPALRLLLAVPGFLAFDIKSPCGLRPSFIKLSSNTMYREILQKLTQQKMLVPVETLPLPPVKTIADCSNFNLTVVPFLPQLYTLPQRLLESIRDPEALKHVYLSTNPLVTAISIALAIAPIFLVVSEINRNYSQVDRFWSIIPTIYAAHFALWAHLSGVVTERLDAVLAFSVFWSVRSHISAILTYSGLLDVADSVDI